MTFTLWSNKLIDYVTPANYLDNLLDDLCTCKQSSNQDVDTYVWELWPNNNLLDSANQLTDAKLCTIIKSGPEDLASGLAKLEEVLNLDNKCIKAATAHHYKREQKCTQVTIPTNTSN
ncbi:hypothetical protein CALCODRAFT_479752 [Calocera cornea HHB12733]|uniref:Uncharacterized protein n=1 Tax=Calocera cornea HHB12733 TaxID=1353952 RepID=A0A165JE52_9BASI|nr:hypothetical protein CALCODRAFT_479752 [Calocera cornea HHB12733]